MTSSTSPSSRPITRRRFLKRTLLGAAGLAVYSSGIERHWIEVTRRDFFLPNLPAAFNGMRMVQLSDIHMDDYTEPFFLEHAVDRINDLKPDVILLTGDFASADQSWKRHPDSPWRKFAIGAAWQCANILNKLECRARYAVLGNHDFGVGADEVTTALTDNGVTVLRNACAPFERDNARIWFSGVDDPLESHPKPDLAIPESIRGNRNEPVVLLCHAPDYADKLLSDQVGQSVDLMLSGHSHGGQIRLPFHGPLVLPPLGRKYVEGWFRLGGMQLYVNRGLGTVGVPFRFDCPPEITVLTLRAGA